FRRRHAPSWVKEPQRQQSAQEAPAVSFDHLFPTAGPGTRFVAPKVSASLANGASAPAPGRSRSWEASILLWTRRSSLDHPFTDNDGLASDRRTRQLAVLHRKRKLDQPPPAHLVALLDPERV